MFDKKDRTADAVADEIATLAGHLFAGTARFLALLDEFDRLEGWHQWGIKSLAHWLSWRCGLAPGAAREHVRVMRALRDLPRLARAFGEGELSYSKVRALTRIATTATEETLLMWARHGTAHQIERIVRGYRRVEAANDPTSGRKRRGLQYHYDDDGSLVIKLRLEPDEGAVVMRALEAAVAELEQEQGPVETEARPGVPAGTFDGIDPYDLDAAPPGQRRRADAIARVAEAYVAGARWAVDASERALIVLHATRDDLVTGGPALRDGPAVATETAHRIACDGHVIVAGEGAAGSIGRRTRVVPRAMRRALRARDIGCTFPGCLARKTDAHHIRHWADGGETSLENLAQLCPRHHRFVHELGFTLAVEDGRLVFRRPDGTEIIRPPTRGDAGTLPAMHGARAITPGTCAPKWDGVPPDYDIAVEGLFRATG